MSKLICTNCGGLFGCQADTGSCWCMKYPALLSPSSATACLCPDCLLPVVQKAISTYVEEVMAGQRENEAAKLSAACPPFTEGIDYYIEDGLYVMTAWSHLKRGYCCGNRCKHCPFHHENVPN